MRVLSLVYYLRWLVAAFQPADEGVPRARLSFPAVAALAGGNATLALGVLGGAAYHLAQGPLLR